MIDANVQIALDDLCSIRTTAQCADIYRDERDSLKKELEAEKAKREAAEKECAELQKDLALAEARNKALHQRLGEITKPDNIERPF